MNKEITNIDLVEGGNVVKQGDYFTIGYRPRNAKGEAVDLTGKAIAVEIFSKDGIAYESTGEFDPGDGLIYVHVNKNIGYGNMFIEFTVTDPNDAGYRLKFPTNNNAGRLTIHRSTDDLEYVGVKMVTVEQLKADQRTFEQSVDGKVETLQQRVETGIGAFTSSTEILDARGGEVNLRARLDKTTAQLAETAKKTEVRENTNDRPINVSEMDTETKSLFTGGAVAVVGENAVGRENVKPKAIDGSKTTFMSPTRNLFDGTYHPMRLEFATGVGLRYRKDAGFRTAVIPIEVGQTYTIKIHEPGLSNRFKIAISNTPVDFESTTYIETATTVANNTLKGITFTNTAEGAFLLINVSDGAEPKMQVEKGSVATDYIEPFLMPLQSLTEDAVDKISAWEKIKEVEYVEQLFNGYAYGTIGASGSFIPNPESSVVVSDDFMSVNPGMNYVYGTTNYPEEINTNVRFAQYDSNKTYLGMTDSVSLPKATPTLIVFGDGVAFARAVISSYARDSFYFNKGKKPYFENLNGVVSSGFAEIVPDGVVEERHLSTDIMGKLSDSVGRNDKKQKPFPKTIRWELLDSGNTKVYHLSRDGRVIYGASSNRLLQSMDEGKTWQQIMTAPTSQPVMGIRELDDGELLFTSKVDYNNGNKAKIFKTSGYKRDDFSAVSATEVLEALGVRADINNVWGLEAHDNIVVASEYGLQGVDGARYAYLSQDYGDTWQTIFDQQAAAQNVTGAPAYTSNAHVHTIHYDRFSDRIWLAVGDQENCATYYSDDMGQSWKLVKDSVGMYAVQYTGITSYPEGVFFGSDRTPDGVYYWERTEDKDDDVYIKPYFLTPRGSNRTLVYGRPFRRYAEKDEVTYFTASRDVAVSGVLGPILVAFKGVLGAEIIYDWSSELQFVEISGCVGDTIGGHIIMTIKNNDTGYYHMLRAKVPVWE